VLGGILAIAQPLQDIAGQPLVIGVVGARPHGGQQALPGACRIPLFDLQPRQGHSPLIASGLKLYRLGQQLPGLIIGTLLQQCFE